MRVESIHMSSPARDWLTVEIAYLELITGLVRTDHTRTEADLTDDWIGHGQIRALRYPYWPIKTAIHTTAL